MFKFKNHINDLHGMRYFYFVITRQNRSEQKVTSDGGERVQDGNLRIFAIELYTHAFRPCI